MDDDSLPTTEQILLASELPILVSLQTVLTLTRRTLLAEHSHLENENPCHRNAEPHDPAGATAASIIILARSLENVVEHYCLILEQLQVQADEMRRKAGPPSADIDF